MPDSNALTFRAIDKNHVKITVNRNGDSQQVIALTLSEQGEKNLNRFLENRKQHSGNGSKDKEL